MFGSARLNRKVQLPPEIGQAITRCLHINFENTQVTEKPPRNANLQLPQSEHYRVAAIEFANDRGEVLFDVFSAE